MYGRHLAHFSQLALFILLLYFAPTVPKEVSGCGAGGELALGGCPRIFGSLEEVQ